jgi:hypothetical protein
MTMTVMMMVAVVIRRSVIATATEAEETDARIGWAVSIPTISIVVIPHVVIHDHPTANQGRTAIITPVCIAVVVIGHARTQGGDTHGHPCQRKEF